MTLPVILGYGIHVQYSVCGTRTRTLDKMFERRTELLKKSYPPEDVLWFVPPGNTLTYTGLSENAPGTVFLGKIVYLYTDR